MNMFNFLFQCQPSYIKQVWTRCLRKCQNTLIPPTTYRRQSWTHGTKWDSGCKMKTRYCPPRIIVIIYEPKRRTYFYTNNLKCSKKTESRCILQAELQRLFTGANPLLSGTGDLTCSVSDLGRCTPPQTTWQSRAPPGAPYRYRTQRGHPIDIAHCSSELLSSNDPPASASQQLGLQAHATATGEREQRQQETWLVRA